MERSGNWLAQAKRDLEKAHLDLEHAYYEWACFTAHQAAEKAVKAVFQAQGRSIRGHALLQMLPEIQKGARGPEELLHAARVLDRYYIEARYPNGFASGAPMEYFDQILATEAIHAADEIVRFCSDHLG